MKAILIKYLASGAAIALACSGSSALAQSTDGEDSMTVGVAVQFEAEPITVSGLEDISIDYDGTKGAGFIYTESQRFCVYTPSRFINMTVAGTNTGVTAGKFYVLDSQQPDSSLKVLTYDLFVEEAISGENVALGPGPDGLVQNNVVINAIDFGNYNSGPTCSDGENVRLTLKMIFDGGGAANPNAAVIAQLADGLPHNYSDVVTITVGATSF